MSLTPAEAAELDQLEAAFTIAGGRGADLAERIDLLRLKRDHGTDDRIVTAVVWCDARLEETWTLRVPAYVAAAIEADPSLALDYLGTEHVVTVENTNTDGETDREVTSIEVDDTLPPAPAPSIEVADERWEPAIDDDRTRLYLPGGIRINDTRLHLIAIEVTEPPGDGSSYLQSAVNGDADGDIDAVYTISAASSPMATIGIGGRSYLLVATPWER